MMLTFRCNRYLDLSFNNIRKIDQLEGCVKLKELFFVHNKITNVGEGLKSLVHLQLLELGANRIRVINLCVEKKNRKFLHNFLSEN